MIDLILDSCISSKSQNDIDFKLLRTVTVQKLNRSRNNRLTTFRQCNEQCRAHLRRIANELTDYKGKEAFAFVDFGNQILDVIRFSLDEAAIDSNKNANANDKVLDSFTRLQTKTQLSINRLH